MKVVIKGIGISVVLASSYKKETEVFNELKQNNLKIFDYDNIFSFQGLTSGLELFSGKLKINYKSILNTKNLYKINPDIDAILGINDFCYDSFFHKEKNGNRLSEITLVEKIYGYFGSFEIDLDFKELKPIYYTGYIDIGEFDCLCGFMVDDKIVKISTEKTFFKSTNKKNILVNELKLEC